MENKQKEVRKLKAELHRICEQIWPWDDWMGRRVMYITLYKLTGKKHISQMEYHDLIKAKEEMLKRLKKEQENAIP